MKEGSVFSYIRERIASRILKNHAVIDTADFYPEIRDGIDLSEVSRDELEERYLRSVMCNAMNYLEYYSVVRKAGVYINFKILKSSRFKQILLDYLERNRLQDITADKAVISEIEKIYLQDKNNDSQQMRFGFGEDEEPYMTDPTTNEILEMLRAVYREREAKEQIGNADAI